MDKKVTIGKLENVMLHKPEYLSGGQQQRLTILKTLAIKPKLLLMDELFSAFDTEVKSVSINELKVIFNEFGTTVLIVGHKTHGLVGLAEQEFIMTK
jgi:molybdate transport system ATP-binding protein